MRIEHEIRINGNHETKKVFLTPVKAIRKHCVECMGFKVREVERCTSPLCCLYPFRSKKILIKKNLTDEQKKALNDKLKLGRSKRIEKLSINSGENFSRNDREVVGNDNIA